MPRNNKNKVKILKAKGGADASKADFGTGVSARDANMGMAGKTGKPDPSLRSGTGGSSNNTSPNVTTKNVTTSNQTSGLRINPVTIAGNLIRPGLGYVLDIGKKLQKTTRQKTAKGETLFGNTMPGNKGMPITRDFYRATGKPLDVTSPVGTQYMKDAGFLKGVKPPVGGQEGSQQLCPDGTVPPCKLPTTQIKKPVTTKNPFLSGFRAYDDGGEVVISSNVDKSLL